VAVDECRSGMTKSELLVLHPGQSRMRTFCGNSGAKYFGA